MGRSWGESQGADGRWRIPEGLIRSGILGKREEKVGEGRVRDSGFGRGSEHGAMGNNEMLKLYPRSPQASTSTQHLLDLSFLHVIPYFCLDRIVPEKKKQSRQAKNR